MITKRQLNPIETNINGEDMQAVATTEYPSNLINVEQHFIYTALVTVVEVGAGGAGDAQLRVQVIDKDKSTVLYDVPLITAIPTNTAGTTLNVVTFGAGTTAVVFGTAALGADIEVFKVAEQIILVLEVTTQETGTSSDASVALLMGS